MKNKDYYIYNGKKFVKSNIDIFSVFYENTDNIDIIEFIVPTGDEIDEVGYLKFYKNMSDRELANEFSKIINFLLNKFITITDFHTINFSLRSLGLTDLMCEGAFVKAEYIKVGSNE